LRSYARRANIRAIPIGIDADYFQPLQGPSADCPIQFVFVGNFRHTPNVQAAQFLLEEIAPHFPALQMVIAGSYAPEALQKKSHAIFTGYVADTRDLFHGPNTIFIAPLFSGTGQRVKLLEAFAMGAAVITTSLGAAGFPIEDGQQAIIADSPEQFRTAVAALATSPELRFGLGRKARQMILDLFTWDSISRQFVDLVDEADCRGDL
jgi:glycosyltransferase involved in cell wall biosynthesis